MRRALVVIVGALLSTGGALGLADLSADQRELLAAWEEVQRSDPQTRRFEDVVPGVYLFETERFPYAGELHVLNLSITDQPWGSEEFVRMGVVEVELADMGEEFLTRHSQSYGFWLQTHLLYYDDESESWLSSREWQLGAMEAWNSSYGSLGWVSNGVWLAGFVVLILLLSLAVRRANRQMKSAMSAQDRALAEQERAIGLSERALELTEESNGLLKEILAALQRR